MVDSDVVTGSVVLSLFDLSFLESDLSFFDLFLEYEFDISCDLLGKTVIVDDVHLPTVSH